MKILLPIDDSKHSEAALQLVVSQIRPLDTEVRVLHVMEPLEYAFPPQMAAGYAPELDEIQKERSKQARELVTRAAEKLRAAGYKTDTAVFEGNIRAVIIDIAADWHADLIVLGSHGRKGLDRFLLGSVSEFVTRHARCSVEIVRLPAHP